MSDDVKHLLGGYATGTLTPRENAALMRAALEDQELFDALADDEALREYLADPAFRQDLLKATAPAAPKRGRRTPWISVLSAAAACVLAAFLWMSRRPTEPSLVAVARPAAAKPAPQAILEPAPSKQTVVHKRAEVKVKKEAPVSAPAVPPTAALIAGQLKTEAASPIASNFGGAAPPFAPRTARTMAVMNGALRITARITDVNAGILTLDTGSNAGIKPGDHLDVLHGDSPIGTLTITTTEPAFSVGTYNGSTPPQIGDIAATPKK